MASQEARTNSAKAQAHGSTGLRTWRDVVAGGAYYSGAQFLLERFIKSFEVAYPLATRKLPRLRRVRNSKYVILCYHRVGTEGIPFYSVQEPRDFAAQMRYLREHYRVLSLQELLSELADPGANRQGVAVTFDDGYQDVYRHAWPILREYRIPVTVYLTAGSVESGEVSWYDKVFLALQCVSGDTLDIDLDVRHTLPLGAPHQRVLAAARVISVMRRMDDLTRLDCYREIMRRIPLPLASLTDRMLTWDQCREMVRENVQFGAHTMSHPVVSSLSPDRLQAEVCQSKALIEERLGTEVLDFAYPFGQPADCGSEPPRKMRKFGFRSAVTTVPQTITAVSDRYLLNRPQLADVRSLPLFALRLSQIFSSAQEDMPGMNVHALKSEAEASTLFT